MQLRAQSRNVVPEARSIFGNILGIFDELLIAQKILVYIARGLGLIFNLVLFRVLS